MCIVSEAYQIDLLIQDFCRTSLMLHTLRDERVQATL